MGKQLFADLLEREPTGPAKALGVGESMRKAG